MDFVKDKSRDEGLNPDSPLFFITFVFLEIPKKNVKYI